jgi:hypothetical protein
VQWITGMGASADFFKAREPTFAAIAGISHLKTVLARDGVKASQNALVEI